MSEGGSRTSFNPGKGFPRLRSLNRPAFFRSSYRGNFNFLIGDPFRVPAFLIKNFWACWFLALAIHATEAGAS